MVHERWGNKGGSKIEIFKKSILVIIPFSIFLGFKLASYGAVANRRVFYTFTVNK